MLKLKNYLIVGMISLLSAGTVSATGLPQDISRRILAETDSAVYYLIIPSVSLTMVDAGDDSLLNVDIDYDSSNARSVYERLAEAFPNKRVLSVVGVAKGGLTLDIPVLKDHVEMDGVPTELGPRYQHVRLLKAWELKALRDALKLAQKKDGLFGVIRLSGEVSAAYRANMVVDQVSVSTSECDRLVGPSRNIGGLLERLPYYRPNNMTMRPSTLADLRKNMALKCFELRSAESIQSFKGLMQANLVVSAHDSIEGKTEEETQITKLLPAMFSVKGVFGGGGQ